MWLIDGLLKRIARWRVRRILRKYNFTDAEISAYLQVMEK